jgi:hypothetical protein
MSSYTVERANFATYNAWETREQKGRAVEGIEVD